MMPNPISTIPDRNEVDDRYKWNLARLFESDEAWEAGLKGFAGKLPHIESFKGGLGRSAAALRHWTCRADPPSCCRARWSSARASPPGTRANIS